MLLQYLTFNLTENFGQKLTNIAIECGDKNII